MKKITRLILLAFSMLCLLTSCIEKIGPMGPMGPQGPQGQPGRDGAEVIDIVFINVDTKDWDCTSDKDNNYYFATVDMPEITKEVFEGGIIKMYRVFDYDTSYPVQVEMPFTRHREEKVGPKEDDYVSWTETLDYEFGVGGMTIFFTTSDFYYDKQPESMRFRCVVMY